MADLITVILFFAILVAVGCSITRPITKEVRDEQCYLHEQHKQQMDQYRKDGRLPSK